MKIVRAVFLRQCNFFRRCFLRLFNKTVCQDDLMSNYDKMRVILLLCLARNSKMPSPNDLE